MDTKVKKETTTTKIIKMLKKENIVYYERKIKNGSVLLLPYTINAHNLRLQIYLLTDNKNNTCIMEFKCKLNTNTDYHKLLLDINSELPFGLFSVDDNSDEVIFSYNFEVKDSFIFDNYLNNLQYCFYVFIKLCNDNIIDKDLYSYKDEEDE